MTARHPRDSKRMPKVLFYDIETSPLVGYTWGLWEQNVIEVLHPPLILSCSFKWADEKQIETACLPDFPLYKTDKKNDKSLVKKIWGKMDEADFIVGHNSDKFDNKKVFARFLVHGMKPPSPFKSIDTLKIARRHFAFDSNKLDNLGKYFGVGRKKAHEGKHTWLGCMNGDKKAWETMRTYNEQDVNLLVKVYEKLRPYASTHPDLTIYSEKPGCPCCQSTKVQKRGIRVALKKKRQALQCQDCGHWFSGEIIK